MYEGRPTQSQLDRPSVFGSELTAAIGRFDKFMAKAGAALNAQLGK